MPPSPHEPHNPTTNGQYCKPIASPEEVPEAERRSPVLPVNFINTGFHEVQIFVKHDPFCIAQIPSMVSNGSLKARFPR